jgi:hypothetical protein
MCHYKHRVQDGICMTVQDGICMTVQDGICMTTTKEYGLTRLITYTSVFLKTKDY